MKSERVHGWEIGYKAQIGDVFLTADVFRSDLYDFGTSLLSGANPSYAPWTAPPAVPDAVRAALEGAVLQATGTGLTRLANGNTAYVLSFGNAGRAREHGAELSVGYRVTGALRVDGNYSWYDADIDQSQFQPADTIEANTPAHSANASLAYGEAGRWQGRVGVRYVDAYRFRSGLWKGTIPSSLSIDVGTSVPLRNSLVLSLSGSNVLDQRRFHVYGGSIIGRRLLMSMTVRH
jgi:outer membrane receptor protein involved in Fe transport